MKNNVAIVTITERSEASDYDFKVKAFHTLRKAEQWIDCQISKLVQKHKLNPLEDIESWFVRINGLSHTIQFDVAEVAVR